MRLNTLRLILEKENRERGSRMFLKFSYVALKLTQQQSSKTSLLTI